MAYEAIAAIGTYIYEAFAGVSAAAYGTEAAGAAAELSAYSAAASTTTSAATYASYASMAAQALGAAAAVQSSNNQAASADYNAKVGEANAQQASMQAGAAEEATRRRSALILGEQRAAFVQSGVDPSSGTGLLAQQQSATNAELDALNARYSGIVQSRGLMAQSALDRRQSQIYGNNASIAGVGGALSTFGAYAQGQGNYLKQRNVGGAGYGGYG